MKNYIFLILFLLAWQQMLWAQLNIYGKITDDNEEPVMGADIYIDQLHIGTTSDESGLYQLNNIPKGTHKLTISFIGFNTENRNIQISSSNLEFNVQLKASLFHMDEIIVSAPFNKLQSENVMKIESKTIETLKKNGAPTLMESLTSIPGVSEFSTGTGIGKPVIRGLSGNRVLVYTQGVRLENQQFGGEHGLGLNESGIESVEVIKGPASLLYGSDALGGVLYMNPEKFAYQNETKINLSQSFFSNTLGSNTSVGVKTSKKKLKFLARGGFNTHSDYEIPDGDRVSNTRFNEMDFKGGVGLNLDQFVTELRYNYNQSKIGITEGIGEQSTSKTVALPYQDLNTHILSLHNHLFLNKSKIDFNLGYIINNRKEYEDEHDEPNLAAEELAALDMQLKTFSYDLKYNFPKLEKFEIILGVQGMHQTNENFGEEILIPDATTNDIGVLLTSTFDINEHHTLQGGIRFDQRQLATQPYETEGLIAGNQMIVIEGIDRDYSNFAFSLGYKTFLLEKITTRVNFASGFRAPNLAELTSFGIHHGTNRFEVGNPNLESEQNVQIDVSLEYGNEHIELFANGFYNHLNNYIFASPTGNEIDGYQIYEYVQYDARLFGGEFGIHFHPHPWDWLHVESSFETVTGEQDNGQYLPLIPANKWANTIRVEFKGSDKFNEIYTSLGLDSFFEQDEVSENESKSPGYNLLGLRMGGKLNFKKSTVAINLSVNNLLNETYISHLSALKIDDIPNPGRNVMLGFNFNFM
jgi:iron complex outermembrane receptor protein